VFVSLFVGDSETVTAILAHAGRALYGTELGSLDFGVGSSWLRGHPQGPESNSGGWLPATSDVIAQVSPALPEPRAFRVTGPLPSLGLRAR